MYVYYVPWIQNKVKDLRLKIAEGRHGITLEGRKQYSESGPKMTFQPLIN